MSKVYGTKRIAHDLNEFIHGTRESFIDYSFTTALGWLTPCRSCCRCGWDGKRWDLTRCVNLQQTSTHPIPHEPQLLSHFAKLGPRNSWVGHELVAREHGRHMPVLGRPSHPFSMALPSQPRPPGIDIQTRAWVPRPTCRLGRAATRCLFISVQFPTIRTPKKRRLVPTGTRPTWPGHPFHIAFMERPPWSRVESMTTKSTFIS
jgi:hypothetical protein